VLPAAELNDATIISTRLKDGGFNGSTGASTKTVVKVKDQGKKELGSLGLGI
jgi:hypothetical protein